MTGTEFVESVAAQQGATKAEVKKIIDAALSAIADATARGRRSRLRVSARSRWSRARRAKARTLIPANP